MKRWLPHAGVALGVGIAVYGLWWSQSEEDRVRARLEQLAATVQVTSEHENVVVRAAKVRKEFNDLLVQDVSIGIPELTTVHSGRNELIDLAAAAPRSYRSASIDLDALRIDLDEEETSAVAHGEVTLTAQRLNGEIDRDLRSVSLRLDKIDGSWKIVSISVSSNDAVPDGR
jgi:hypothetical protein